MDRLPEDVQSKFRYVLLAANRAEQLMRGARPKVDVVGERKLTSVALEEVNRGVLNWSRHSPAEAEAAGAEEGAAEVAEAAS